MNLLLLLLLTQLPASFPAKSVIMRGPQSWVILATDAAAPVPQAEFSVIGGRQPVAISPLPDGSGVVFTAPREDARDGLFLSRGGVERDLSVSGGYHGWPAVSPDGKWVVFAHNAGRDSGEIGLHGSMMNAQLWRRPLATQKTDAGQLTDSPGCKSSPSVLASGEILFGHNSCRGTQGVELLNTASRRLRVVLPLGKENDQVPAVSPDRRWLAVARQRYDDTVIVLLNGTTQQEVRTLAVLPRNQRYFSLKWSPDSKQLFATVADEVVSFDALQGSSVSIYRFKEGAAK